MTIDLFNPPSLEEIEKLHGPVPKPGRTLVPEELAKVVRSPPKPRYSAKGERWARERLVTLLGAELNKNTDELKTYTDQEGNVIRYRTGGRVDYSGQVTLLLNGCARPVPVEMEVKTFQDSFPTGTLRRQYNMLDQARQRALALVCLVEHQRGTIVRGWYIPWRQPGDPRRGTMIEQLGIIDYADLIQALQDKAMGNYKGKSFRHQDHDLLIDHVVEKVSGRWRLCSWLERLKPFDGEQLSLF